MFERFKALRNLHKAGRALKGVLIIADITNDQELETLVNDCLLKNSQMRKAVLKSRKKAKKYGEVKVKKNA